MTAPTQDHIEAGEAQLPAIPERNVRLPVAYESAVQALAVCQNLDEAKVWGDKADALAAWAKIYRDDRVAREARALKLRAYRRIGELALELVPPRTGGGRAPGIRGVVMARGFNNHQADAIGKLTHMPVREFNRLADSKRPPSPATISAITMRPNPGFARLSHYATSLTSQLREMDVPAFCAGLEAAQVERVQRISGDLIEKLTTLRAALLKRDAA